MSKKSSFRPGQRLKMAQEDLPSMKGSRHGTKRVKHEADHINTKRATAGKKLMKLTASQLRGVHMRKLGGAGTDSGGHNSGHDHMDAQG